MMLNILDALYKGELKVEEAEVKSTTAYGDAMKAFLEVQQQIEKALPADKLNLIDAYAEANADVNGIVSHMDFIKGYRLGAMLMLAVFIGPNELAFGPEGRGF